MRTSYLVNRGFCAVLAAAGICGLTGQDADASTIISDYMIIAAGDGGDGQAFTMSDSEIGAIGSNSSTSPPGSVPSAPAGGAQNPATGISLDGDVAITATNGTMTSSNSDVHAANTGAGSVGSQGIDCASSYATCTDSGSQISSGNRFNTSAPTASFSDLDENNGVQGGIDHSGLLTLLTSETADYWNLAATDTFNINTINANRTDTFGSGLHVIDIDTDGNDLLLQNSTWSLSGQSDTFVIFRVSASWIFDISQARLGVTGNMGLNNVLFLVDGDQGETSFTFDNVYFNGISFWDYGRSATDNTASFNNVAGCGQIVTDAVNFQNVSMSDCSYEPTIVSGPPAFALMGSGLVLLGLYGRRRKT